MYRLRAKWLSKTRFSERHKSKSFKNRFPFLELFTCAHGASVIRLPEVKFAITGLVHNVLVMHPCITVTFQHQFSDSELFNKQYSAIKIRQVEESTFQCAHLLCDERLGWAFCHVVPKSHRGREDSVRCMVVVKGGEGDL